MLNQKLSDAMLNKTQLVTSLIIFPLCCTAALLAQPNFKELPGYEKYREISALRAELSGGGRVEQIQWSDDGKSVQFSYEGKRKAVDLTTFTISDASDKIASSSAEPRRGSGRRGGGNAGQAPVGRAQQRTYAVSPDGKWKAVYANHNVSLESIGSDQKPIAITENGQERLRFGTGCWVYGEELDQNDAMWWSDDSTKLAYYEIDERELQDYHLTLDNTANYTKLQSVRYPKAGDPNPKVALWVYDVVQKTNRKILIDGEPTQYLYSIRFAPKSKELLVHRTNRRQDVLNVLAVDTETLKVREVVSERQSTWQKNSPTLQFLEDHVRFVWETEANGWKQFQLRHFDGRLLNPLSPITEFACNAIVKVDEPAGYFYYSAFSDANPYNAQLHRVGLDGTQPIRLTSSPLNHTFFDISPDHRFVIATREQLDVPPCTVLYDNHGKEVLVLAQGSREGAEKRQLAPPELFSFVADDGKTTVYGTLHKPSGFDPSRKYPLIIDVYGGPASAGLTNRYTAANPNCEFGYLIAKIGNRGTVGRGKAFESATYLKLGGPDLDDQAAGVRYLSERPYVDGSRVGIYGHSYGGYMSALALLRYPKLFHVAVAGAPVTDFRNYDTIYTERYMQTPAENPSGYDAGSCNRIADQLQGKLLLVHGLIDDNVHPANTWQLAKALHAADKRFQMMIYPEFQHGVGSTYPALRWEYFHQHLKP
jgi:dipeptidyl-peptidase-4